MHKRQPSAFMLKDDLILESEPTDIIFIVHGIGYSLFPKDEFQKSVKKFTYHSNKITKSETENKTILYIPINWGTEFHSLDSVDEIFKTINLKTVPTLRKINNSIISDCFFYFSDHHRQNIIDIVYKEIYCSLEKIKKRWPNYEGKYGFIGHSLGGVIVNDILCNSYSNDDIYKLSNTKFSPLGFDTTYFISFGSPISAVNTMRGIKTSNYNVMLLGIEYRNIFHSHDPIAYKIEPLLSDEYKNLTPVILKHYVKRSRNKGRWSSIIPKMRHSISKKVSRTFNRTIPIVIPVDSQTEVIRSSSSISSSDEELHDNFLRVPENISEKISIDEAIETIDLPLNIQPETPKLKRYDYCDNVSESIISSGIDYIIGLRAHMCYWDNKEVIFNTLSLIYDNA